MREGRFDSSLDRIQTAFCGHLRELLATHAIFYNESDTLPQLYAKLHTFYGDAIQPPEVAELIRTALRSGSGIISALNDARNKHTPVHPNSNLIEIREARLMIQLTRAIVDYLEDIEINLLV